MTTTTAKTDEFVVVLRHIDLRGVAYCANFKRWQCVLLDTTVAGALTVLEGLPSENVVDDVLRGWDAD